MDKILVTPRSLTREGHPALDLLKETGYNVITTPHIGGFTVESINNAARVAVENLLEYLTNT